MSVAQPFSGYEILSRIGSGAMGTVFKARQKRMNRIVALKVLRPSLARNLRYVERLRREAHIVAALNHPNIVAGYDLGEEGGYHFFVMEYFEGRSLRDLLKEWGVFPELQVLDVAIQITEALDHAFARGVIHRDIKPGNILIDEHSRVKLTDMGLAKGPTDLTITRDGATVGTPQYISPEQASNPQDADVRSDLYSLGATLYHMATGQAPFGGETMAQVIHDVLYVRAPSPTEVNPALSEGFSLVTRKLLAKDREQRYQTPAELLADLRRVRRAEQPAVDLRQLDRAEGHRPRRRGRWLAAATAVLALWGLALAVWPRSADRPKGLASGDEDVRQRLNAQVLAAPTLHDKLETLQNAELGAHDERLRHAVREKLVSEFTEHVTRFAADEEARMHDWFARAVDWRELQRVFDAKLATDLHERLAVTPAELPVDLREVIEQRLAPLRQALADRIKERDATYLALLRGYLAQTGDWRTALERGDFVTAEQALRERVHDFHARDGRPPCEMLPPRLAESVAQLERAAIDDGMQAIGREEERVARALAKETDASLQHLAASLKHGDPHRVRDDLDHLADTLAEHYPPASAFPQDHDPWPDVNAQLRTFELSIRLAVNAAEQRKLGETLTRIYALMLACGEAREEIRWLAELELEDAELMQLRDRHRRLLEDAQRAADQLLEALLNGRMAAPLQVHAASDPQGPLLSMVLRKDRERAHVLAITMAGKDVALPFAGVRWSDLLAAAGWSNLAALPEQERPRLARGLAVWLLASNCRTADFLAHDDASFFVNHVLPLVNAAQKLRVDDAGAALDVLHRLQQSYERRDLATTKAALEQFESTGAKGPLASVTTALLGEIRAWVDGETRRAALEADLRGRVPARADVSIASDGRAVVTYDAQAMHELASSLWSNEGDDLGFHGHNVLSRAFEQGLVLPTGFAADHSLEVEIEVRFPEPGSAPRIYLMEVHGVGLAVGLLQDNAVVAALLRGEQLAHAGDLERALQKPLAAAAEGAEPMVVPGAVHRLRVSLRASPAGRADANVSLDDTLVAKDVIVRPPRFASAVRIGPLEPLAVRRVRASTRL